MRSVSRHLVLFLLLVTLLPPGMPRAAHAAVRACAATIAVGDTLACTLGAAAETDTFAVAGSSGDVLLLRVANTSRSMTPAVRVLAPDGTLRCSASTVYSASVEIARCALVTTGTHTIAVADASGTRTGSAALFVERLSAPAADALAVGTIATATLISAAQAQSWTLAGAANAVLLLGCSVGLALPACALSRQHVSTYQGAADAHTRPKRGNSLAVRIPKSFAIEVGIEQDSEVELSLVQGKLMLVPVATQVPTLQDLLQAVSDDNLHAEVDAGAAVGRESW